MTTAPKADGRAGSCQRRRGMKSNLAKHTIASGPLNCRSRWSDPCNTRTCRAGDGRARTMTTFESCGPAGRSGHCAPRHGHRVVVSSTLGGEAHAPAGHSRFASTGHGSSRCIVIVGARARCTQPAGIYDTGHIRRIAGLASLLPSKARRISWRNRQMRVNQPEPGDARWLVTSRGYHRNIDKRGRRGTRGRDVTSLSLTQKPRGTRFSSTLSRSSRIASSACDLRAAQRRRRAPRPAPAPRRGSG